MNAFFYLKLIYYSNRLYNLKEMSNNQKYYHNDYKKQLGVDQSRTASEKLLDKAIGGFKRQPIEQKQDRIPQKKVKEQNKNLTPPQIFTKILKNLQGNTSASKLLKPLALIKKCLNDPGFAYNSQLNTLQHWMGLVQKLFQVEEKAIGNYSQINLMNQQLLQIFLMLQKLIKSLEKGPQSQVKIQQSVKAQQNQAVAIDDINGSYERRCTLQILYCKMHTDDSFVFNKTLLEFKKIFFDYFQSIAQNPQITNKNREFFEFKQNLLMKLFKLPYTKHEWVKTSLSQFFKQFNITYKMLLEQQLCQKYLKSYNQFLNYKLSRGAGEQVNVFGNSGKGGKITQIQTVSDGLDKWTSRQ